MWVLNKQPKTSSLLTQTCISSFTFRVLRHAYQAAIIWAAN